jgi:acetyltransferase-like isoleucine patch superfamily enzyme
MLKPGDFFDLSETQYASLFDGVQYVWEGLKNIKSFIQHTIQPNISGLIKSGPLLERTVVLYDGRIVEEGFALEPGDASKGKFVVSMDGQVLEGASVLYAGAILMNEPIEIGRGTVVEPGALIKGPAVLGDYTEVRQGAYIRGDVLVGHRSVVGHTTEMKHAVMLGGSKAGHFAYIGDSILGRVNLGAGTKLANVKINHEAVKLRIEDQVYETGLRKFGAVCGDGVELGCNSVTSPGTLLGRNVQVYPNTNARGFYPPDTIVKLLQNQVIQKIRKD